jgi:diadenosine tetraphosphate (Ap4A) HIT family hydrolase
MDDELVVFEDWKPAARRHYLVCPRAHILSARSLGAADAAMARRMLEAGRAALEADFPDERDRPAFRFGFHLPPFNSVDHLHMHAFALPFEPEWKERKYSVESWARFAFEPAEETVARVETLAAEKGGAAAPGERRAAAPAGAKTTKASSDRDPDADPARRRGTSEAALNAPAGEREAAEGAVVVGGGAEGGGGEGGGGEGGGGEGGGGEGGSGEGRVSGTSSSSRL